MARLIHLNGPPGIGKSTLAGLWVERHPGTLDLDIDRLHELVGGWRDPAQDTHRILRPVAHAMAATHLAAGHDVIVPQTFGRLGEIDALEAIAATHDATFVEVVLLDARAEAINRFQHRDDDSVWGRRNRERVAELGGEEWLGVLYDRLTDMLAARPSAVVIPSGAGRVEQTYAALAEALERVPPGS